MRLHVERRLDLPRWLIWTMPIMSVIFALVLAAILMIATGQNPLAIYSIMLKSSFGSTQAIAETVVKAIPLMLIGLGIGVAMRMRLWNIGAEGQFYIGAMAASWLALFHPELPQIIMLPGMILLGFVAGGIWATIATIPRAYWNVNEVITTLMLNSVATLWVAYLVNGPWEDPEAKISLPFSAVFVPAAQLPTLGDTRVHFGLVIGLVMAVVLAFVLARTRWGYEIRAIGQSVTAARFAGMRVTRNILVVMFLSGGLAGIAGMTEVSGVILRLQDQISPGYGFTAIIVAALARMNPIGVVVVSFLFGMLLVSGFAMQSIGVSASLSTIIQGVILFAVLCSEFFLHYKMRLIRPGSGMATEDQKKQGSSKQQNESQKDIEAS